MSEKPKTLRQVGEAARDHRMKYQQAIEGAEEDRRQADGEQRLLVHYHKEGNVEKRNEAAADMARFLVSKETAMKNADKHLDTAREQYEDPRQNGMLHDLAVMEARMDGVKINVEQPSAAPEHIEVRVDDGHDTAA